MQQQDIFYPALALVGHTFLVWCWMYVDRIRTTLRENIPMSAFRDQRTAAVTPGACSTASDNLKNLFELPVLFYFSTVVIYQFEMTTSGWVVSSWLYVGLRVAHSVIHVTYNNVIHRFAIYILSSLVLWVVWLGIAIKLIGH